MTTDDGRQPEEPIGAMELILGIGVRELSPSDYKLRNCPFCDSTPEIDRYPPIGRGIWIERTDGSKYFSPPHPAETVICCKKCNIRFSDIETMDVVERWNGKIL